MLALNLDVKAFVKASTIAVALRLLLVARKSHIHPALPEEQGIRGGKLSAETFRR